MLDANGKTWLDPVLAPVGAVDLSRDGRRSQQRARLEAIHARHAALQSGGLLVHLRDSAFATFSAAESARTSRRVSPDLAFNTAVSFTTNTNWQSYGGESTMSYFSQMVGLAFHNFVSAATGIAIAAALVRAIARHSATTLGNFWVDLVRVTYYLLLPICLVFAVFLVSQGMIQNFKPYTKATLVEPMKIQVEKKNDQGRDDQRTPMARR